MTLDDVARHLKDKGENVPTSTLSRVETGKTDPGVRRLHLLLSLYDIPPHLVADLIELESTASTVVKPDIDDLEALHRKGVEHFQQGNIAAALGCVFAVRQHVPNTESSRLLRERATIAFATWARNLGKFRLARQILDRLLEESEPLLVTRVLTLYASLWRGLGSRTMALAMIRQAEESLDATNDKEAGWVLQQKARLLLESEPREARRVLGQALTRFRRGGHTYSYVRGLVLRVEVLQKLGETGEAVRCARRLIRISEEHGLARGVAYGQIVLGHVLVQRHKVQEGITTLRAGLARATELEERAAQFYAHYYLWKTYAQLDDAVRADIELSTAAQLVGYVDFRSPETEEVRRAMSVTGGGT